MLRLDRCRRRLLEVNTFRGGIRILAGRLQIRPPACFPLEFCVLRGTRTGDGLLYKRPALTNTTINLLGKDLETLIAEKNRLALLRFRKRRDNGQMIARVQRDGLSDHPHIAVKVVEPGVHIVEMLAQQIFDRWSGVQKMLESSLNKHALADARSVGCDVKPTADAFTQTNRHFATRSGFAVARRSNVNAIDLRIQFGELLHVSDIPQCPTIETAASRYN